ncbi:hypothetical protein N7516_000991 [Penicillium verrucosum]|uniref:uncharacterized protein n=1 Tax=Penicillium verrucosum TaxID=60171 RepID=UPI0025458732|nr:uncharacterized protein N7516_000991 [Penicillium verrucosum]KAJ5940823.1 hypothetical protein N7516_000991 [Penicillium verrucosum]
MIKCLHSSQFNFTKEMFIAEIAEYFQQAGFTTLTYDPRSIGQSDGSPRNNIDPSRNAADYHDALSFLKTHPLVDPSCIAFWGFSFSGMVALTAAALDKRAKAVVAVCPLSVFEYPPEKWPGVLSKAMKDRESQLGGNKPFYIPMITDTGENPAGFGSGIDQEGFNLIIGAKSLVPNFELPTTLQSYYHIAAWQPLGLMPFVSPTPVMVVTPELDLVSPAIKQKNLIFDKFDGSKRHLVVPGKGHMDVLSGNDFGLVLDAQVEFLRGIFSV